LNAIEITQQYELSDIGLSCIAASVFNKLTYLLIRIQTAGLAFGGTGLCSCRVRGVDGSYTKHLTVESYMVIYASNGYTYYY